MPQLAKRAHLPLRLWPGAGLLALALALLWAQLLGLAHGVLHPHGPVVASGWAHDHDHMASAQAHDAHAHRGLLDHLLAPAGDEDGCRLYDPLAQDAPASVPQLLLPTALPLVPAWVLLQAARPRVCVAFLARAPPVSR